MTLPELDRNFDAVIRDVESEPFGNIMVKIGSSATTLIRERIIKTGETAEGGKYPPYSTKPMLSGCKNFLNQLNCPAKTKSKRKELKWVTLGGTRFEQYLSVTAGGSGEIKRLFEIPGGYKEFRELNQKQTGFVDFAFSNRMWANIKLVSSNSEHNQGIARIAATTDEDKKKLEGNTKRKGDILKLSQSELGELTDIFDIGLTQIFERHGLK